MRFRPIPLLFAVFAADICHGMAPQSSFGPEISAEDFGLHLARLTDFQNTGKPDAAAEYTRMQFERLGLAGTPWTCHPAGKSLLVVLNGTDPADEPVVYLANTAKPGEVAAVLEIAERFMTQRPRPSHDVLFLISPVGAAELSACNTFQQTARIIQPTGMEIRDASSLVRDLIELQRQGR